MSNKVSLYVVSTVAAAILALTVLVRLDGQPTTAQINASVCFGLLAILADILQYKLESSTSGTIVFIPIISAACISPNWAAAVVGLVAVASGSVFSRQSSFKATFNIAQDSLCASLGVIVYRALGGRSLLGAEVHWPAYVAMFGVFIVANSLLFSGVLAVSGQQKFLKTLRATAGQALAYDLMAVPFPFLFAVVYSHFGTVGIIGLSVPLLGARQLYMTNRQLEKTNQELLQLMVAAMEARDPYTSGHSTRVSHNAKIIGRSIGISSREVERVGIAALLHDVGKIHENFAPILRKPGKLTPDERLVMQTHPIKSAELVQNVSQLRDLVTPIRHHHENWDGTGYPDGLAGDAIPLWSRIIMFADTIDAMTTDRPYRAALTEEDVRAEFMRLRGRQFDPHLCDVLLASPLYPLLFERATKESYRGSGGLRASGVVRLAVEG